MTSLTMANAEGARAATAVACPMAAGATPSSSRGWQYALLSLCAICIAVIIFGAVDTLGFGGTPWFGYWDANAAMSARPYTIQIAQPRPDGAAAQAGLRDGDLVDLRRQSLLARVAVAYQPMAAQLTALDIRRGSATLHLRFHGSTVWQGATAWKVPTMTARWGTNVWVAGCILLLALRKWGSHDARMLALVLFGMAISVLDPTSIVVPSGAAMIASLVVASLGAAAARALLVKLAFEFGARSPWRRALTVVAYVVVAAGFCADMAAAIGFVTLSLDPVPFVFRISMLRGALDVLATGLVAVCASSAVLTTPAGERPRAAWLLLPIPLALMASSTVDTLLLFVKSWFANLSVIFIAQAFVLISVVIVMYALLKRRVLDFEFVLSRTLMVAAVSLIVVASFVLLEWALGTALAGASHATGLIANGALALLLGLSLNAIHKRVDALMDALLFRKRHEDERALASFAKEAAFMTNAAALLDQAIEKIQLHTDAREAALFLEADGVYTPVRSFGAPPPQVNENDAAILALKTWHKPLDPHHYHTALRGALAIPMVSRARVLGLLLLGERAGGEAYAPDEIEALEQFAHGVGASLDSLSNRTDGMLTTLQSSMAAMADAVARLARETDALRSDIRGHVP